ncbi:TspO/MBR family protein [Sphingomonas sp. M1A8_2b]
MSFLRWAVVTVPLILLLGFASGQSVSVGSDNAWYTALAKPALNPPGWVFPVVWTTLYVMMGLAIALILNARGARQRALAVGLFVAQFVFNLAWTPMFFGAHKIGLSVLVIVAMLVLSIAATFVFARIRPAAAWLMVPYMVWISFAGVLAFSIGQLNPGADTLAPVSHTSQML